MRKSQWDGWQQAYNAQAVVNADGSQLILGENVAGSSADAWELEPVRETYQFAAMAATETAVLT